MIQNNNYSYYLDKENGLPIKTFKEDKSDREFYKIVSILEKLAYVNDVRDYIKLFVYNNQINYERATEIFSSLKPMKENSRYIDNKNFKILSVEKLTSSNAKPNKVVDKVNIDYKSNTNFNNFRASNKNNKNSKILTSNNSQKNNISYNKSTTISIFK